MILIADGGSTKVDWIALDEKGERLFKVRTKGLNPVVVPEEVLKSRVLKQKELESVLNNVTKLYFYGAGCGTQKAVTKLSAIFRGLFATAEVHVAEDLLAAVYAASSGAPAIVAILGTGSNSCYYDGKNLTTNSVSLGYMVMDEASGNYFGKRLVRDFFYQKMPPKMADKFESEYDLDADVVKENLYSSPNPNTYLANFAAFMFKFKDTYYIQSLINKGFEDFFNYRILPYHKDKRVPIYFIGSIAHYFGDLLSDVAHAKGLHITGIIQRPIDNLVDYHRSLLK